jgi:NADPH:quinone reductase
LQALASRGRLICVGTTAGRKSEIDLGLVLRKRATIVGTVLRARSTEEKAEATRRFAAHVRPLVSRGVVRPVIDQSLLRRRFAPRTGISSRIAAAGRSF